MASDVNLADNSNVGFEHGPVGLDFGERAGCIFHNIHHFRVRRITFNGSNDQVDVIFIHDIGLTGRDFVRPDGQ
jgi:hypothetical protein